jgi:hypothetical protein
MLHLPEHLVDEWPAGTLVRIDREAARLVVSRADETEGL